MLKLTSLPSTRVVKMAPVSAICFVAGGAASTKVAMATRETIINETQTIFRMLDTLKPPHHCGNRWHKHPLMSCRDIEPRIFLTLRTCRTLVYVSDGRLSKAKRY